MENSIEQHRTEIGAREHRDLRSAEMEQIITFIEPFDEQMQLLLEGQPDRPDVAQS